MPLVLARRSDADFMRKSAHNSYLSFLAEGGVVAAVPLALLLGVLAVRGSHAAAKLNRRGEQWALGVYGGFIAMSVHFWVLSGLTGTHAWFVYGLLASTIYLASLARKQEAASMARAPLTHRRLSFKSSRPAVVASP
jgi:O-antigen ligase